MRINGTMRVDLAECDDPAYLHIIAGENPCKDDITANTYQGIARKTAQHVIDYPERLAWLLGLAGEIGELIGTELEDYLQHGIEASEGLEEIIHALLLMYTAGQVAELVKKRHIRRNNVSSSRFDATIDDCATVVSEFVTGSSGAAEFAAEMLDEYEEPPSGEAGDVLWYLANYIESCGTHMGVVMLKNIVKLQARYPKGHFVHDGEDGGK